MIIIVNKLSQYLCSICIAIMKGKDADYTELIRLGDKSMYEAKDV